MTAARSKATKQHDTLATSNAAAAILLLEDIALWGTCPGVAAAMPGQWYDPQVDPDFFSEIKLDPKEVWEISVRDADGDSQGSVVIYTTKIGTRTKRGVWVQAKYICASDPYYRHWMSDGDGHAIIDEGYYHFCLGAAASDCTAVTAQAAEPTVHFDKLRFLSMTELGEGKVAWFNGKEVRTEIERWIEASHSQKSLPAVSKAKGKADPPIDWDVDVADAITSSEEAVSDASEKEDGLKKKLKTLSATLDKEVPRDRKGKKAGKSSGSAGPKEKDKKREKARKEAMKAKKSDKKGRSAKKKKGKEDSDSSSSPAAARPRLFAPDVDPDSGGARKKRKKHSKSSSDRGPFGAGEAVDFCDSDENSSADSSESSFRDALTSSSHKCDKHLLLVSYAQKYPGRLASRLLLKMATTVNKGGGAASSRSKTPACAMQYYLTILQPLYRDRLGLRNQREIKTWCHLLDCLARGQMQVAADVAGQRLKALERQVVDGAWNRAQFLELIDPEGATLLEKDEDVMLAKEAELELRLKSPAKPWQPPPFPPPYPGPGLGKGKDKDGKGRGRGKTGWKGQWKEPWKDKAKVPDGVVVPP
jgi:hypothetical protein